MVKYLSFHNSSSFCCLKILLKCKMARPQCHTPLVLLQLISLLLEISSSQLRISFSFGGNSAEESGRADRSLAAAALRVRLDPENMAGEELSMCKFIIDSRPFFGSPELDRFPASSGSFDHLLALS
jgi:hypothetical protein